MALAAALHQRLRLSLGRGAVVGMDEVEQDPAADRVRGMTQQALEGGVDEQQVAALVHDAHCIGQQVQHLRKRGQARGHGVGMGDAGRGQPTVIHLPLSRGRTMNLPQIKVRRGRAA